MDVERTADFKIFIVTLSQHSQSSSPPYILFTQVGWAAVLSVPARQQSRAGRVGSSREEGEERLSEPRIDQENKTTQFCLVVFFIERFAYFYCYNTLSYSIPGTGDCY